MRLCLDQMFSVALGGILKSHGHDVLRAEEVGDERAEDDVVLVSASSDRRVLITLDHHFVDWAVLPLGKHEGVVRVKVKPTTTENVARLLLPFLSDKSQDFLRNHLVILSRRKIRWIKTD